MRDMMFAIGRGIGQVMFQNNALSGLLMWIGILCNSWTLALLALSGTIVSTLAAYLFKYSYEDIRNGLYGFNGTLVGIAVGVFMEIHIGAMLVLVAGSILSTWIAYRFNRSNKLPGYTAPFILAVWGILIVCHTLFPSLLTAPAETAAEQAPDWLRAFFLNIGQVMFQGDTILAGAFFLLAILINSRTNAFYTIWGAALPLVLALLPGTGLAEFNAGLFGYNAVLCAIALGDKSTKGFFLATLAVLLSTGLQIGGMYAGLTTLTAPFVLAVWITRWLIISPFSEKKIN